MDWVVQVDLLFSIPFPVIVAQGLEAKIAAGLMEPCRLKGFASRHDPLLNIELWSHGKAAQSRIELGGILELLENRLASHAEPSWAGIMGHPMLGVVIALELRFCKKDMDDRLLRHRRIVDFTAGISPIVDHVNLLSTELIEPDSGIVGAA